ncbi:MAG: hypothetical protein ABSF50_00440 [Burkholderiaceae bacterium]
MGHGGAIEPGEPLKAEDDNGEVMSRAHARRTGARLLTRTWLASALTILLSSLLLFLVQPILAKQILPWFGGSSSVWITCLLFFQVVLLLGYLYAHALTRKPRGKSALGIHVGLLLLSCLALPIIPSARWKPETVSDPTLQILLLLSVTIGLPYFLLASTSPLLQKWLSDTGSSGGSRVSIYRLFALSNVGSLIGLLAYPFAIEPYASAGTQARLWSAAYLVDVLLLTLSAWRMGLIRRVRAPASKAWEGTRPPIGTYAFWVASATLGCVLLLSVTNHITQNIASIPFLWIVPLSLYLSSFIVCFESPMGYRRRYWIAPVLVLTAAMAWGLVTRHAVLSIYIGVPLFCVGLFCGCILCHGELARSKPEPGYLTQFYLCLAGGGALGGVLVALVAPRVFSADWEAPLALVGLAFLGLYATIDEARDERGVRWLWGLIFGTVFAVFALSLTKGLPGTVGIAANDFADKVPVQARWTVGGLLAVAGVLLLWRRHLGAIAFAALLCTCAFAWNYYDFVRQDTRLMVRNFYGSLRVQVSSPGPLQVRRLMNGVILHGAQYTDPDKADLPTTYYGRESGIGRTLRGMHSSSGAIRVASVGLGTGTLAAYGKPGDVYRIYELNPEALRVAQTEFTFLRDTGAHTDVVLGDARLSLERELEAGLFVDPKNRFDVLSLDAFSSDAIPVHLLTREAFVLYAQVIKPDGVIAVHTSNRYLDLPPIVAAIAREAGFSAVLIEDRPTDEGALVDSDWVLVTRNSAFLARDPIGKDGLPIDLGPRMGVWDDQFNDLFHILK